MGSVMKEGFIVCLLVVSDFTGQTKNEDKKAM